MMSKLKILVIGGAGTGKSTTSVLIQQALNKAGFDNVTLIDEELTNRERAAILVNEYDNDKWKQSLEVSIEQMQTHRQSPEASEFDLNWWNHLTYEEKCEHNHDLDTKKSICPREYRHEVYKAEGRECMYCDKLSNTGRES